MGDSRRNKSRGRGEKVRRSGDGRYREAKRHDGQARLAKWVVVVLVRGRRDCP